MSTHTLSEALFTHVFDPSTVPDPTGSSVSLDCSSLEACLAWPTGAADLAATDGNGDNVGFVDAAEQGWVVVFKT